MQESRLEPIEEFQKKIMSWWSENARNLPWRVNPTPYQVLVSEIMLQQTQVSRVIPKYHEFLNEFPTIEDLASADTKRLVSVWCGLGYNRRAIWLKEAAGKIVEMGEFPQDVKELRKLKGIGPYASRSILIFAFNKDLATVDTNIRRILIASGFADETMSEKQLQEIADELLLRGHSSDWHNALMDYGSSVLTASSTGIEPISKQSKFTGSTRQIRGAVIRILSQNEAFDMEELSLRLEHEGLPDNELKPVIEKLVQDNLLECTIDDKFKIAG